MMRANAISAFKINAGRIAKPEEYEFHWLAEFKDGSMLTMFGQEGAYTSKIPFSEVQKKVDSLHSVVWNGVTEGETHFGVCWTHNLPAFMIGGSLYQPSCGAFFSGTEFIPDFFIRNSCTITTNTNELAICKDASISYFAGFKLKADNRQLSMYISCDGLLFHHHGFSGFDRVGRYEILNRSNG